MIGCPESLQSQGVVRDVLMAVDCPVRHYAVAGYDALGGPGSPWPTAITVMLTLYVAVLGYRLIFAVGAPRLADSPLIALRMGAILALTLNWSAFQTLVFNLQADAPMQIARVVSAPMSASGSSLLSDPLAGVQRLHDTLQSAAQDIGGKAAGVPGAASGAAGVAPMTPNAHGPQATTASSLDLAGMGLLIGTVGVLATSSIAASVLTALGPIFIALALFDVTRGLFFGWARALIAAAIAPMLCWIALCLMLAVVGPSLEAVSAGVAAKSIDLNDAAVLASIVLVFVAAQFTLILLGAILAGGLGQGGGARRGAEGPPAQSPSVAPAAAASAATDRRLEGLAASMARRSLGGDAAAAAAPPSAAVAVVRDLRQMEGRDVARPRRLGETYRRGAPMRDRMRLGETA